MRAPSAGLSLALALFAGSAIAQPSFQGLGIVGPLPDGSRSFSYPYAISGDGKTVVGYLSAPTGYQAFRWTQAAGIEMFLPGTYTFATAVSRDGAVIAGDMPANGGQQGFRWTQGSGPVPLGDFPGGLNSSVVWGCSADGSVITGTGDWNAGSYTGRGFRWTSGTGLIDLGKLQPTDEEVEPWGCSGDGLVICGGSGVGGSIGFGAGVYEAFRWTPGTGMVGLGRLGDFDQYSFAQDVSADGKVIVGCTATDTGYESFRWTQADGMVGLGDLPGGPAIPNDGAICCNADGSIIGGIGNSGETTDYEGSEAFIWDATHGIRNLQQVLTNEHHLNLRGWELWIVLGISDDGKVLTGYGKNPFGEGEAWIVRLESCVGGEFCPSDFNKDGFVTGDDFDAFVDAFYFGC